ncbi:MAG TPA: peptidylprolyl isomerase, partial [Leptolyngbyaceae cyanobacterium M65_K2018_010]|nr:peptidylprolyl isomerase [Leptolyngbyaceae cyanobacterium M65_K2018_010]
MGLNTRLFTVTLATLIVLGLGACANSTQLDSGTAEPATDGTNPAAVAIAPDTAYSALPTLNGTATVELVVNGSPILIQVDGTNAPITAGNFVDLVNRGVYNGLVFHRVVRDPQPFVVQGGDPQSKDANVPAQQLGTGSFIDPDTQAPRYIPLEIKPTGADQPIYSQTLEEAKVNATPQLTHRRGAVAMARSQANDSASSQFYIALAELPFLDGNYAVFGY